MTFWQPSKKHLSPIWIKTAFWIPCFEKCSPIVYRPPHLIATGNAKPHPLLKNISHLYARKSGFRDHFSIRIYIMFTNIPSPIRTKNSRFIGLSLICLHFVYVLTCYLPLNSHGKSKSLGFIKKHFSPIWIFKGVLAPLFEADFKKYFSILT